jgi:cytochrome c-type biogenesis protein CcsB
MDLLIVLTIFCYLASSAGYFAFLFLQRPPMHKGGYGFLLAGFCVHTIALLTGFWESGHIPVTNLYQTLSVAAWALVAAFLGLHYRYKLNVLGVYTAPLTVFILLAAYNLPKTAVARPDLLKSLWLVAHIVTIFLGDAALALAAGAGILYLLQENTIKRKSRGFFFKRLPSLELLDNTGYACIVSGFTLLTVGLVTGIVYAKSVWGRFWSWDPKEVWSAVTWLFYAILLHERLAVGWRGRRAAWMSLIGFAVMIFTFLGVNFLLKGHHGQFTNW